LCISDETQEFIFTDGVEDWTPSVVRGHALAKMYHNAAGLTVPLSYTTVSVGAHDEFANIQQVT